MQIPFIVAWLVRQGRVELQVSLAEVKKQIQSAYSNFLKSKNLLPRYGQKLMIAEVARALSRMSEAASSESSAQKGGDTQQPICVVEAGTGTGKTIAYLLPALIMAKAFNKKLVVSTATIALQEQIVMKDLPDLMLGANIDFSFRLAKGRGRYLCLAKLDRLLSQDDGGSMVPIYEDEQGLIDAQDITLYQGMMQKLGEGEWQGDRDEWADEIDTQTWQRVTTDHHQCTGRKCSFIRQCAFFKAREDLEDVDCVVANHDLVLADLALGGGAILPETEKTIFVFDEGHHLPDKALAHFSKHLRYKSTIRWLGQCEGQWKNLIDPLQDSRYVAQLAAGMEDKLSAARKCMEESLELPKALTADVLLEHDPKAKQKRLRFTEGKVPEEFEYLAQQLSTHFTEIVSLFERLSKELDALMEDGHSEVAREDLEKIYTPIGAWGSRAEACLKLWQSFSDTKIDPRWPMARWITLVEQGDIIDYEIVSSPVMASSTLAESLWHRCAAAVLTSATMTALNSFDRFKMRAGTDDSASYAQVPSPFDFQNKAELHVPRDCVDAKEASEHTDDLIERIPTILSDVNGALVLFSSRRQMQEVYEGIDSQFRQDILMQGSKSKQAMLVEHRQRVDDGLRSVIFGLASFAEGVDLPGAYCTTVVIAKIPFSVPDDPLEAAYAEWVENQGGNSFMQISVPDASVRLVQAAGRLLRTENDTGKIYILDKRLISKRYGRALLESLPPFKQCIS